MKTRRLRYNRVSKAFTLAEVLLASSILSITIAALSQTISGGQAQTSQALHELRAISLAEALMEEVLSMPYDDPEAELTVGPDAGESTRSDFDNADDFHGYTESAGNTVDEAGVAYPALYDEFSRSVAAAYSVVNVTEFGGNVDGLSVTVTVTDTKGAAWYVTRFLPEPTE